MYNLEINNDTILDIVEKNEELVIKFLFDVGYAREPYSNLKKALLEIYDTDFDKCFYLRTQNTTSEDYEDIVGYNEHDYKDIEKMQEFLEIEKQKIKKKAKILYEKDFAEDAGLFEDEDFDLDASFEAFFKVKLAKTKSCISEKNNIISDI